jgi:hypothetical protein
VAEVGIEVGVYLHTDPLTQVDILNGRMNPSYLEEMKGKGGGDVTVSIHDPKIQTQPNLLAPRNVLKFKVAGKVVGAMVIGKKASQIIDETPEGEVYKVSGEGLRTWGDDAVVYPSGGLKANSFNERSFNFASEQGAWYNPAQWVTPTKIQPWGDHPASPWRYAPTEWPDAPNAFWVWSQPVNGSGTHPEGDVYFRYEFDVAVANQYSLFFAGDNYAFVYVDGQMLVQNDQKSGNGFTNTTRLDFKLEPGHHIIGIKVTNAAGGPITNPGGLIAALYYYGDPNVPSSAVLVSYTGKADAGWKVNGYPTQPPGWSPGEILHTLLAEAEGRGVKFPLWLTPTFSATTDSYGQTWDRSLDWSFNIGDSITSVIEKMEELVCDVWIDPDTLQLHAARQRGIDRSIYHYAVDGVTPTLVPVQFRKGWNLGASSVDVTTEIANSLAVFTADGWVESIDAESTSVSDYGRIEAKLDTGVSAAVSAAVAKAVFQQKANPEEGASYEVIPRAGSIPFVDFQVGDWVLAPNTSGLLIKRRVMSISVEETEAGTAYYSIEFDTIFQDNADKLDAWLKKVGGGALGGSFANSGGGGGTPIGVPVIVPPTTTPLVKLPLAPEGLEASSVGLWSINGVEAYSEVTLYWEAVTGNTDGSETVPAFYEVWAHLTSDSDNTYTKLGETTENQASFRPYQTGTNWTFKVRAMNSPNAPGQFSDPVTHTMVAPDEPMLTPDTPTLSSSKGVLIVTWTGRLQNVDPPPQFRYVYAKVATAPNGPYNRMGSTLSRDGRNIQISGLTVGNTYWVKLVAVDGLGIPSLESAAASITLTGIDLGDLDTSIGNAIDAAHEAALLARGMNNMLNDPGFEANDPEIWSLETANVTNIALAPHSGSRVLRINSTTSEYVATRYGLPIEVVPGETYQFSAWVRSGSAASYPLNGITIGVEYGPNFTSMNTLEEIAGAPAVNTVYAQITGDWLVPAGIHFVRPVIISTDLVANHAYLVDDLIFRMVIPGALILNGAVSADKIGAGAIIAGKIAAGAIAAENIQANTITAAQMKAGSITANELAVGAVRADNIEAGAITTIKLASEVGRELDISSNDAVNIIVGQVDAVTEDQNATAASLETMQTYYQFGPQGAVISSPGSPFALALRSDRIEMLQLNVPVSYWNAGQMFVRSLVGEEVILGNHKLEKYGTGTVVRTL